MTDQQLARAVVQGTRLQPLFYMELAGQGITSLLEQTSGQDGTITCEGVWFYVVAPRELSEEQGFAPVAFSASTRESVAPQLETTMTTLVEGMQQGRFFIVPGQHCERCDVRPVCHRTHPASARRAREDHKQIHAHRNVRRQQPPKPPAKPAKSNDDS